MALKSADLVANLSDLIFDQKNEGYRHWERIFGDRALIKTTHYIRLGEILSGQLETADRYPVPAATLRERLGQFRVMADKWPGGR